MKQTFRVVFSTEEYVTVDTDNKTKDEIIDLILENIKADALEIFYIDDEKANYIKVNRN